MTLKVSSATGTISAVEQFPGLSCKSKQHLILVVLCKTKVAVSSWIRTVHKIN